MKPKKSISNHVFKSNGRYLIYCRVSTGHQGKSGLGVRSQLAICKAMANRLCLKPKVATCFSNDTENYPLEEGVFIDSGVSAYEKSALDTRPAGGRLILTADPGDTVIVSRLDRAFRSVKDFLDISQQFLQDGVRLVVCSPMIDFGTAAGNMLGSVLASFAEFESRRKSERIKDALAAKKRRLKLPGSQQKTQRKEAVLPQAWLDAQERQEIEGFTNEVTGKPGLIYIYTRVSHPNSTESGLSLEAQEDRGRKYAQWLLEVNPNLKMGIVLSDKSISAVENPLFARPCGAELNRLLKDGDQVIFPALDRGFRSIEDFSATLPIWTARGVTMHFAYENLDMNDPACRMMASMLVSLAEF